jgi:hypothetical protein
VFHLNTKKWISSLSLILIFGFSNQTWSANYRSPVASLDCPELELPEPEATTLSGQKAEPYSYPIAATQLIDFYSKSVLDPKGPHHPSSPLILGLESKESSKSIEGAIQTARKNGLCIDSESLRKELNQELVQDPEKILEEINRLSDRYPSEFNLSKIFAGGTIGSKTENSTCVSCGGVPNLQSKAINNLLSLSNLNNRKQELIKMLENTAKLCGANRRNHIKALPEPVVKEVSVSSELYSVIQDRLGSSGPQNKQPLALDICKSVLAKGRGFSGLAGQQGIVSQMRACKGGTASAKNFQKSEGIAVTVYGSRRDSSSGRCELKLKSSLSPECQSYSSEWPCKEGNVWVDMETLGRNTLKAVYLPVVN